MSTESANSPFAIVVMGVSGSGKSTVGECLAQLSGARFVEGDHLHPAQNVEKMARGFPLTDEDRMPWLDRIGIVIKEALSIGRGAVISCSCLKQAYRDRLRHAADGRLAFVFLEGPREVLLSRMGARHDHFMPVSLLDSQLQTLELPVGEPDVVSISIDNSLEQIVYLARDGLENIVLLGEKHAG